MTKGKSRKIGVIDFETDPFLFGRVPKPFACEFLSDERCEQFWGDDCAEQLIAFLDTLDEPHLIYAHNGGKFDFHFMFEFISDPILVIKTRIVEATLGKHKLRDSYAILPVPLSVAGKLEIDYDKMEAHCREEHRDEILEYMHVDCVELLKLVSAFNERFGPRMTIGGTAFRELQRRHPFRKCGRAHDERFRPFYFGGRVQFFESGLLPGPWKLYDVNSMYPYAMKNFFHPINGQYSIQSTLPDDLDLPFFARITATNRNALPSLQEDATEGLTFRKEHGEFFACSHEIKVALEHGLIDIHEVHECYVFVESTNFSDFVDEFYAEKAHAKSAKDFIGELFAKLILNSAYGRCGINPENFADWIVHRDFGNEEEIRAAGYEPAADFETVELWSKPSEIKENMFADVAIAASITSAARATLLSGLQNSERPVYCDTDAVICKAFKGDVDKLALGYWDLECEAENVVIAGKKLYAMFDHALQYNDKKHPDGFKKLSSKGGRLRLHDLLRIAEGEEVHYQRDAPTFSLKRDPTFIGRTFKMTT